MPRHPFSEFAVLALVAVAATVLAVGVGGVDGAELEAPPQAGAWAGLVGGEPAEVDLGQRVIVVLKLPSLADRVFAAGGRANDHKHRRWTRSAASAQRLFISRMTIEGARIQRDLSFTRVLNGFSAILDPRSLAVLERSEDVDGIYPVRAAFPAAVGSLTAAEQAVVAPPPSLPGFDGRGVTVALLDTGVDRSQPALARAVLDGVDVVGGSPGAEAAPRPGSTGDLERHGTEAAGILVGAADEGGARGVAPAATLLPIRVAGWQPATGGYAIYARTDQILAGLDRAVDPNGDGDAHDAVRVALVGLAEHFSAFADDPLARAASGALALDTLVVAAAGNDGPKGPGYGSISAPGGAPDALTVAAADVRVGRQRVRLVVRAGLDLLVDRPAPLGGLSTEDGPMTLRIARPRLAAVGAGAGPDRPRGPVLADFFDPGGFSRVAGAAALVPGGRDPSRVAEAAAQAGAAAVLVYGSRIPSGALGLGEGQSVPVVSITADEARRTLAALEGGASVGVSLGSVETAASPVAPAVASFSSRGLAFDGRVKPELAGPGVAVLTTEPGVTEDGAPRLGTLNGSSAAAAVVAGVAAALAQARPALDASGLKGVLVGSAQPLAGVPVVAQGAGLVDPPSAAAVELAAAPAALAVGRASGEEWKQTRPVIVRNVSSRRLRLRVAISRRDFPAAETRFSATPRRLSLRSGGSATIRLRANVLRAAAGGPPAQGLLVVRPRAGLPLRIPFAVAFAPKRPALLGPARLSRRSFEPSDAKPTILTLVAGSVRTVGGVDEIEPLARLDVELWTDEEEGGERLGVIARVRDLLPGTYTFGLTGRDPDGEVLDAGPYRLRLVAYPVQAGKPVVKTLQFTVK